MLKSLGKPLSEVFFLRARAHMKVIFLKEIFGQGRKNQVKEVSDGYAKNFLIPKGFAVPATDVAVTILENQNRQKAEKERRKTEKYIHLKEDLDKRTFTLAVKATDKNVAYGSVDETDVANAINQKIGSDLDKRKIILPKHIKELGEYEIEIKLGAGISAHPKIKLIKSS